MPGDALHLGLAEELERLAPFGMGNPSRPCWCPRALLADPRPWGRAGTSRSRSRPAARARAACRSAAAARCRRRRARRWTPRSGSRSTATTARSSPGSSSATPGRRARPDRDRGRAAFAAGGARASSSATSSPGRRRRSRRRRRPARPRGRPRRRARAASPGCSATSSPRGEPVLAVAAHAGTARRALRDRVGGFAITTWAALEEDPALAAPYAHVVAIDPPATTTSRSSCARCPARLDAPRHGAGPRSRFARRVHAWELDLRAPLADALPRAAGGGSGRGVARAPPARDRRPGAHRPRSPAACCGSSRSSSSPTSTAPRCASRSRPPRRAPRSSARPRSAPTGGALRTAWSTCRRPWSRRARPRPPTAGCAA